jgi:hypothetical protein
MKHERKNVGVKSDSNRIPHGRQFRTGYLGDSDSISIKLDLEHSLCLSRAGARYSLEAQKTEVVRLSRRREVRSALRVLPLPAHDFSPTL